MPSMGMSLFFVGWVIKHFTRTCVCRVTSINRNAVSRSSSIAIVRVRGVTASCSALHPNQSKSVASPDTEELLLIEAVTDYSSNTALARTQDSNLPL